MKYQTIPPQLVAWMRENAERTLKRSENQQAIKLAVQKLGEEIERDFLASVMANKKR